MLLTHWFGRTTAGSPAPTPAGPAGTLTWHPTPAGEPPVPARFLLTADPAGCVGRPLRVAVAALDGENRVVPDFTGAVWVTGDGAAVEPVVGHFAPADRGVRAFTVIPRAAGRLTVTACAVADFSAAGTVAVEVAAPAADRVGSGVGIF